MAQSITDDLPDAIDSPRYEGLVMENDYLNAERDAEQMIWEWIEDVVKPAGLIAVTSQSDWQTLVKMTTPAVAEALRRAYRAGLFGERNREQGARLAALFIDLVRCKMSP